MRWLALDRIRGLAIILMLVDHGLAVAGSPWWSRVGPTRASLPLFMLVSGWLLCGRSRPSDVRCVQLAIATVAAAPASALAGLGAPDILLVYSMALVGWHFFRAHAVAATTVGLVTFATFPVTWYGYHPGYVLGLLGVGALLRQSSGSHAFRDFGDRLPACFARVGQYPLTWFVGSTYAFVLIALVLR